MPDYDFHQLSPIEFEELTLDLLQEEFGITFEKFSVGRDQGIDLRYSKNLDGKTKIVVQCKHYVKSTWSQLKNKLQKEKEKVKILDPERYIFCTSQSLSPNRKDKILEIFHPYIKNTADIFGRDDFNNLLGQSSEIEKRNFKLWFTSTEVVQRILNNDLYTFSEFTKNDIVRTINTYVQTEHFESALELLQGNRCCILVGDPGVGKTTLAKMIIYHFIYKKYNLVVCSENISDGIKLYDVERPQIFYYDDFLGQTALTKLGKNEETRLSQFINRVRESKNKIFILTSRDYILQRGINESDKLNKDQIELLSIILNINEVSDANKGLILYNHLFHSGLALDYFESIIEDKAYLNIIQHKNYSPRIIETLTDKKFLDDNNITSDQYAEKFIQNLDNPVRIWDVAFNYHLDNTSRNILYALVFFSYIVGAKHLYEFVRETFSDSVINWNDYKKCLEMMDGTFIRTGIIDNESGKVFVSFKSPSIRDYLENQILADEAVFIDLLENSSVSNIVTILENTRFSPLIVNNEKVKDVLLSFSWNIDTEDDLLALMHVIRLGIPDISYIKSYLGKIIDEVDYFYDVFNNEESMFEFVLAMIKWDENRNLKTEITLILDMILTQDDNITGMIGSNDDSSILDKFNLFANFLSDIPNDYCFNFSGLTNQYEYFVNTLFEEYSHFDPIDPSFDESLMTDDIDYCGRIFNVNTDHLTGIIDEIGYVYSKFDELDFLEDFEEPKKSFEDFDELFSTLLD